MTAVVSPTLAVLRCLAIVPAYNEAASIAAVVAELRRDAPGVDILVIDDGSTDGTAAHVPAVPGVALLRLPFNLGIGGAMQTGYLYAARHGYDVAVQVDGDGQHPAAGVLRLVASLQASGADLVIGSRFLVVDGDTQVGGAHPTPARRAGIGVLRSLIRTLTGLPITDPTSGFRAAGPRAIAAFAHWYPDDYPEPEVVLLLHRAGYRVTELPVAMRERAAGRSSIRSFMGLFYVLKVAAALLLDMVRHPWSDLPQSPVTIHQSPLP